MATNPQQMQVVSLDPDTFTEGGLWQDADGTVTSARFVLWNYGGKGPANSPALKMVIRPDQKGEAHEDVENYWSAGTDLVPSQPDGKALIGIGGATVKNSTNLGMLIRELVNCQFPKEKFRENDISMLEGLSAHWVRIPQPKREGLVQQLTQGAAPAQGMAREKTVLVPKYIIKLPWDKGTQPATGRRPAARVAAAQPTAAAAQAAGAGEQANGALEEVAQGVMIDLLSQKGAVTRKALKLLAVQMLTKAGKSLAEAQQIAQVLGQDAFLTSLAESGILVFDDQEVRPSA